MGILPSTITLGNLKDGRRVDSHAYHLMPHTSTSLLTNTYLHLLWLGCSAWHGKEGGRHLPLARRQHWAGRPPNCLTPPALPRRRLAALDNMPHLARTHLLYTDCCCGDGGTGLNGHLESTTALPTPSPMSMSLGREEGRHGDRWEAGQGHCCAPSHAPTTTSLPFSTFTCDCAPWRRRGILCRPPVPLSTSNRVSCMPGVADGL